MYNVLYMNELLVHLHTFFFMTCRRLSVEVISLHDAMSCDN